MWDYEGFIAKAQIYFARGREHPVADDDGLAHWLLLGLEFLLRAPLAKINPALLAEPNGNSIMHACGIPLKPDSQEPKSIQTKTVILRLGSIVPGFDKEREEDASFLVGLRNQELHSSTAALELDSDQWLPHFTRVTEIICQHLDLGSDQLVGRGIMNEGRTLVGIADQKLMHEVEERIRRAREFFSQLRKAEIEARTTALVTEVRRSARSRTVRDAVANARSSAKPPMQAVNCPACNTEISMILGAVRSTDERLEDFELVRDVIYIARVLSCPICDLELNNTAEIRAAGIPQQYIRTERESLEDRFTQMWDEAEDYGND